MESEFNTFFNNKACVIEDLSGNEIFKVKIEGKCFLLNPLVAEQIAFLMSDNSIEV